MSELSVLELEAQHSELLPEREALGVVGGPIGHNRFDSHNSGHGHDTHSSFGHSRDDSRGGHGSFGHSNNRR